MSNSLFPKKEELNYRALYGKLFSGLLNQFGTDYIYEIEDAIQNSFLKSLKLWKHTNVLENKQNWLFIVARNDVLNQVKARQTTNSYHASLHLEHSAEFDNQTDLRLQTIVLISDLNSISKQAKILFVLKNIFGLSIAEISDITLLRQEAIYKSIKRAKTSVKLELGAKVIDLESVRPSHQKSVTTIEEILYSVFNIGFDSFNDEIADIVNKDLCIEAIALTRLLCQQQFTSTRNLMALLCFHTARIPAKVEKGKLISFFNQDRTKWDKELINLGFHYLTKPEEISKFYIEAVIVSKYMLINRLKDDDWKDIVRLYESLQLITQSPIVKLNYCFCLSKLGKIEDALTILSEIEKQLPNEHIYFSLVKAKILKEVSPKESNDLFISVINKMKQNIRKEFLADNELIQF